LNKYQNYDKILLVMKKDIHPEYKEVEIKCACGSTIKTRSTADNLSVEICASCHPFFTGKQKLIDTAGRVDKFKARVERAKAFKEAGQKAEKVKKSVPKDSGKEK